MIQKAQAILAGLASIFGKYHGKFWRDTPPEPQGANCAVVPLNKNALDGYAPSGMENSRFPVPSTQTRASVDIDSLTKEDLSLAESADLEKYKALYKEVLEEYGE